MRNPFRRFGLKRYIEDNGIRLKSIDDLLFYVHAANESGFDVDAQYDPVLVNRNRHTLLAVWEGSKVLVYNPAYVCCEVAHREHKDVVIPSFGSVYKAYVNNGDLVASCLPNLQEHNITETWQDHFFTQEKTGMFWLIPGELYQRAYSVINGTTTTP